MQKETGSSDGPLIKAYGEFCAGWTAVCSLYRSVLQGNYGSGKGKADAKAFFAAAFSFIKALEYMRKIFGGYSAAAV